MTISKLYISHVAYNFNKLPGIFLNERNINRIVQDNVAHVCKTSASDLTFNNFAKAINAGLEFELVDIDTSFFLNLTDIDFCSYGHLFLLLHESKKPVANFKFIEELFLDRFTIADQDRKSKNKTLWVAGCSFTEGVGVEKHQRFGDILSQQYYTDYDYINLAKAASSIWYQATKILQSDIKKDDLVVWGITASNRIEFVKEDCVLKSISQGNEMWGVSQLEKSQRFWSDNYFYSKLLYLTNVNMIASVVNYCKKIEAKLVLVNFLEMEFVPLVFKSSDVFLNITKNNGLIDHEFLDYGFDKIHPGPLQHIEYTDKIHKFIQERYFK